MSGEFGDDQLAAAVKERCPYLFAARHGFISQSRANFISDVVAAIESTIAMPAYRQLVLAGESLGLLEINTNAGGAMRNALMARAHRSCCLDNERIEEAIVSGAVFEETTIDMFRSE